MPVLAVALAQAAGCATPARPPESGAPPGAPAAATRHSPSRAVNREADLLLQAHNAARQANRRIPLQASTTLDAIAQAAAELLAAEGRLTHDVGGGFARRLMVAGYPPPAAENLALGYRDAEGVIGGWMRSRQHRSNLLGRDWTHVGFGIARCRDGSRIDVAVYGTR